MWFMMDTIDVPVEYDLNAVPYLLSVHSLNDNILIDRIYIGLSPNMPGNGVAIAIATPLPGMFGESPIYILSIKILSFKE